MKVLILSTGTGEGHNSAGKAMLEQFRSSMHITSIPHKIAPIHTRIGNLCLCTYKVTCFTGNCKAGDCHSQIRFT